MRSSTTSPLGGNTTTAQITTLAMTIRSVVLQQLLRQLKKKKSPLPKFLNPFFQDYWEKIFDLNTDLSRQLVISQTFQAISAYNM